MKTSAHMKNVESFDSSWENKNDIKILFLFPDRRKMMLIENEMLLQFCGMFVL